MTSLPAGEEQQERLKPPEEGGSLRQARGIMMIVGIVIFLCLLAASLFFVQWIWIEASLPDDGLGTEEFNIEKDDLLKSGNM